MNIDLALEKLCYKATSYVKHNGSTILTVIAAGGVVLTGISVAKATPKAIQLKEEAEKQKGDELTTMETVVVVGPTYVPSICIGAATIACIFGANVLNQRKQAALTSAYMMLDNYHKKYTSKLKELYGEEADISIRDAIMLDERNTDIVAYTPGCGILPYDGELVTFYERYRTDDPLSSGYFEATMMAVHNAEYHLNRNLAMMGFVSVNDFYEFLGLPLIEGGDVLGWDIEYLIESWETPWIDFDHRLVKLDDGLECYVIEFPIPPTIWEQ